MRLPPPKNIMFVISIVLGLLSQPGILTILPISAFWLLFLGFLPLVLGLLVKGL